MVGNGSDRRVSETNDVGMANALLKHVHFLHPAVVFIVKNNLHGDGLIDQRVNCFVHRTIAAHAQSWADVFKVRAKLECAEAAAIIVITLLATTFTSTFTNNYTTTSTTTITTTIFYKTKNLFDQKSLRNHSDRHCLRTMASVQDTTEYDWTSNNIQYLI